MKKKKKLILYILMFTIGLFLSYKTIEKKKWINNNEEIIELVLKSSFQEKNIFEIIQGTKLSVTPSIELLQKDYEEVMKEVEPIEQKPIIYLYNSHPTEEYASSTIGEFYLNPTVIMNNYILEDIFEKNGLKSYVEEESVRNILEENNWNYASSYRASRILLEKRKQEYPSLKYFIDIHRDSLGKDRTTIQIGDRSYAKILFIVGLENENFQENLDFTERINEKLNTLYPGLSKGIYKKEGPGVNGVYNQDFSPRTILVEMGGNENTTIEVLNSSLAFSKCFMEVYHEENH